MSAIMSALTFLVGLILNAYIYVLLMRLFLQKLGASWQNPLCQFVVRVTEWLIRPVRKVLPGIKGFDCAIIFGAWAIQLLENYIQYLLQYSVLLSIGGACIMALGMVIAKAFTLFTISIVITAILSWFPRASYNPFVDVLQRFADYCTRPLRRFIPVVAGFDLSPMAAIVIFILLNILVTGPLIQWGLSLAI